MCSIQSGTALSLSPRSAFAELASAIMAMEVSRKSVSSRAPYEVVEDPTLWRYQGDFADVVIKSHRCPLASRV
jgi:hypothetical protein